MDKVNWILENPAQSTEIGQNASRFIAKNVSVEKSAAGFVEEAFGAALGQHKSQRNYQRKLDGDVERWQMSVDLFMGRNFSENRRKFFHLNDVPRQMDYNHYGPHSSLAYMTPTTFAELCCQTGCVKPHAPMPDEAEICGILS